MNIETTQRIMLYQQLIRKIDAGEVFGMCVELAELTGTHAWNMWEVFPELWEQRPRDYSGTWYWYEPQIGWRPAPPLKENMHKRKAALEAAIKLLQ